MIVSTPEARNIGSSASTRGEYGRNAKLPKIDFPHFGEEGPRVKLRRARKYFQLYQVPNELRLGIAEMYLKDKADIWFDGFIASHPGAA